MWSRPLRSDELMHGHKYIDKVRTPSGAWRYIYDLAGGKYKKEASRLQSESRQEYANSEHARKQIKKHEHDAWINKESRDAHMRAVNNDKLSDHHKTNSYKKFDYNAKKYMKQIKKPVNMPIVQ